MSGKKTSVKTPPTSIAEQLFHAPVVELFPVQETAMQLYLLGMNVFPMPYGKKGGYPWGMLQYTRLLAEHIYPLFRDRCNLAVMTGRTSGNLFVIDCETARSFTYHEWLLKQAGIPIWAVRSNGKRNGGHFYLRCAEGEVRNVRPGERKDVEVRGNRCYVLAPPSLHPQTNRLYQWHAREQADPPVVSLDQVHWLGLTTTRDSPRKTLPLPFMELSSATREFLINGAVHGERNNRLFAAACDLAGCAYEQQTALQLLLPITYKIGLSEREARDTINSAYSKPRRPAKPTARAQNRPPAWQLALWWAEEQVWKGRTGQTDRAVFLACCERARSANETGVFRASTREIAELARITPNTASNSLKRLVEAKFILYCGTDSGSKAHLYRLGFATQRGDLLRYRYTITLSSGDDSVSIAQPFFSDAAEREALNKTAAALYEVMSALRSPARNKDLVATTGWSKYQISRALKRLEAFSLVRKVGQKWQAIPMSTKELDESVARPAGTLGKGEQRKLTHQRERAKRAGERLYRARFGEGYSATI